MSEKNIDYNTAFLLSIFVGYLGIDRFYIGDPLKGLLKLFTAGGFGIWWIIDILHFNKLRTSKPQQSNEARLNELLLKYNQDTAVRIIQQKPIIGDSTQIILDMFGNPQNVDKEETANYFKQKLQYGIKKGGGYILTIELKDGIVTKITDKR